MNDVRWTGETGKSRKDVGRIMKLRWIVGIIAMIALAGAVSASDTIFSLAHTQGMPGDTITIPVTLKNANGITSMDFEFDTFHFECEHIYKIQSVEKGSLTQGTLFDWKASGDDRVHISLASSQPISGTGTVAMVTVKVKSTATDAYCDMHVKGTASADAGKEILLSAAAVFKLAPSVKGDGDHDGKVTTNDALAALQMAVGKTPKNLVYDMNGDNEVTARDVREILKLSVVHLAVPQKPKSTAETGSTRVKEVETGGSVQMWKP